ASPRFAERERVSTELERAGERCEALLQLTLGRSTDAEQRRRVNRLLDKLVRRVPSDDDLWQLRAIQVLELRGDPDSREQLRRLPTGAASRLTTDANEAQKRLK